MQQRLKSASGLLIAAVLLAVSCLPAITPSGGASGEIDPVLKGLGSHAQVAALTLGAKRNVVAKRQAEVAILASVLTASVTGQSGHFEAGREHANIATVSTRAKAARAPPSTSPFA